MDDANPARGPWRLRVSVLDGLQIECEGRALPLAAKARRKPLDLLNLLVAHDGGGVGTEAAINSLWPSLDAQAPRAALDMAVSRLRRLLLTPQAVRVREGRIGLDQGLVWTDVAAVAACLQAAEHDGGPAGRGALDELLRLYRRPFAPEPEPCTALALRRGSLAVAFDRVVRLWGRHFEARGQWADAADLYRRALEREPLAEDFHGGLMRCHLHRGAAAEALRAFAACAQLLQQVLGVPPSAETLGLAAAARATARPST